MLALSTIVLRGGDRRARRSRPGRHGGWRHWRSSSSNTFYSYGESLTASFLPELARPDSMGRVSGWGWSFGYFGGMLSLGLSLGYVLWAQARGLPATHFVPVTMLITAGVYGVASLATFALLRERAVPQARTAGDAGLRASVQRLAATWRNARRYRDFMWLLACGACYQAGISVVIALAAVYAEQVLGFKQTDTMALIFMVNIAAALGAFALRLRAGPHRPQGGTGRHAGGLDRDDGARCAGHRSRRCSGWRQ